MGGAVTCVWEAPIIVPSGNEEVSLRELPACSVSTQLGTEHF